MFSIQSLLSANPRLTRSPLWSARAWRIVGALAALGLALLLAGCHAGAVTASAQTAGVSPTPAVATVAPTNEAVPAATVSTDTTLTGAAAQTTVTESAPPTTSYLLFNQRMIEGLTDPSLDLTDADAVFARVFTGLPDEVTVYPSENYYYFVLYVDGRQVWGNIRLAAGSRERGELSFGYFEFVEFPTRPGTGVNGSKFFTKADGVDVIEVDRFTWLVRFDGKEVLFHLNQIPQTPPTLFELGADEVFVERTFDESGYQFFLLFNETDNYFFWVLNEETPLPDVLDSVDDDLLLGKRSGFAFWVDAAHDDRKVLMAIRKLSVTRNDYYDGPFDQLADNYAAETNVSEYMQRAFPALRGRIDQFGYYTDRERPMRVALSTYYTYYARSDLAHIVEAVRAADDPIQLISKRGLIATPTPASTPTP